ncbi:unnamed protein product [Acidocella sp. C78]|nr:unnamed protein product [Acidocella sp. C78]
MSVTETATATLDADLAALEAESIEIIRETAAGFRNPVMLYSIGKDSSVMLHLAMKAFYPAKPPFPLMHVDTGWKFREMIRFRDETVKRLGLDLIVRHNAEAAARGVNPFDYGASTYTQVMKTETLKAGLDELGFDAAFGGARRDEEKSRAKERVFSVRTAGHGWDPKAQRPEIWNLFNTRLAPARPCGSFRSRTGPRRISGTTSPARPSPSCRSISPRNARWSSAAASS